MSNKIIYSIISILIAWCLINSSVNEYHNQFIQWSQKYGKIYSTYDEYVYRYNIYKQTLKQIQIHNKKANNGQISYFLGKNQFSDITDKQFVQSYLNNEKINDNDSNFVCQGPQPPVVKDIPQAYDWSAKSAVTKVKKLGNCANGGYAVAATQTIESGKYITKGRLTELSSQQIIDCSSGSGNKGCTSGNVLNSFDYIHKNGIASQSSYPWKGATSTCSYHVSQKQWEILGCVKVNAKNQTLLKNAVYQQPIATSINAAKIKSYTSGVYESGILGCKTDPNHWMVVVGWGVESKKKYWKLKNSWGSDWGMQGYLYIIRNGDGDGQCGMQCDLYFPID